MRGSLEKEILARLCHAGKSQDSPVSDRLDLKSMIPKGVSGFRANMLAFGTGLDIIAAHANGDLCQ
ncbi:hypothetical protein BAE36_36170 [Rhizobium leguminosarum bv. trifolii]|nr:hypothetical protein BAE36_36170 [Rhizobium leguminosarum bv. trifolii]